MTLAPQRHLETNNLVDGGEIGKLAMGWYCSVSGRVPGRVPGSIELSSLFLVLARHPRLLDGAFGRIDMGW